MGGFAQGSVDWYRSLEELLVASGKLGEYDAIERLFEQMQRAAEGAEVTGAQASAWAQGILQLTNGGRYDRADRMLVWLDAHAKVVAERDPAVAAKIGRTRSNRVLAGGDIAGYRRLKEAAIHDAERAGDLRAACDHRAGVAYGHLLLGGYAEAEREFRDCLAESRRMGLGTVSAMMENNLGLALARQGKLDEARAVEEEALAAYLVQGDLRMGSACRYYLASFLVQAGELEAAEREARDAVAMCEKVPPSLAEALGTLTNVLLARKKNREALEVAERAHALLTELGSVDEGDIAIRLAYAEALCAVERIEDAKEAIRAARTQLIERAEKIADERWRRSFLDNVPENARTMALANEWRA
jgi:tetratricopeptide (TPR) repeat protein